MAWTEQCKVAFHANCTAKLGKFKNKNRKLSGVLKELSKESGIPYRTLENWWYDQTHFISRENTGDRIYPDPGMMCIRCGENSVHMDKRKKKPYSEESKYYGLCNACRRNQQCIAQIDREASAENGAMTVCPHCEKVHYVFDESKFNRRRGENAET
jgi:hypothetical protein